MKRDSSLSTNPAKQELHICSYIRHLSVSQIKAHTLILLWLTLWTKMVVERLSTSPNPITHLYPSTELVTSHKNNLKNFIRWIFHNPFTVSISFIHLFYFLLTQSHQRQPNVIHKACFFQHFYAVHPELPWRKKVWFSRQYSLPKEWNIAAYHNWMQKDLGWDQGPFPVYHCLPPSTCSYLLRQQGHSDCPGLTAQCTHTSVHSAVFLTSPPQLSITKHRSSP